VRKLYKRAAARHDLVEHFVYLAGEGGEVLAERFLSRAEASCEVLLTQPECGSPLVVQDPGLTGIRKWPVKDFENFLILFAPRPRRDDCASPIRSPRLVAVAWHRVSAGRSAKAQCMRASPAVIRDAYLRYTEAKQDFFRVLERCALRGWPDRKVAIRNAVRLQELLSEQERLRLSYLEACDSTDSVWQAPTIAAVYKRLRDDWKADTETALLSGDAGYAALQQEIEQLQVKLDSEALTGPLEMAKRDEEFVAASRDLAHTTRALDGELGATGSP